MMDKFTHGLHEFIAAYMNDLVIFSNSWEDHIETVLELLKKGKTKFGMEECVFSGYIIGNGKVKPEFQRLKQLKPFHSQNPQERCFVFPDPYK